MRPMRIAGAEQITRFVAMRPSFLSKLKVTVGDHNWPALQLWIVFNFVSMALILLLGTRLGWAFFASHASSPGASRCRQSFRTSGCWQLLSWFGW